MKNITNNCLSNSQIAIIHLFRFDMHNFDGTFKETLFFTDNDIFVKKGYDHVPVPITFDVVTESSDLTENTINITIDNLTGDLIQTALQSEWRNNPVRITRIIYTPKELTYDNDDYEFGYGSMLKDGYPQLDMVDVVPYDEYRIFEGIIDGIDFTEKGVNIRCGSDFVNWNKPYPTRTFNQREFTEIISVMDDTLYWGRNEP